MSKKIRKNVQLAEEFVKYIEEQSDMYGLSQSGFINLCIKHYKDQQIMINEIQKFQGYFDRMENLMKQ